jgi:hypothetical protein
VVSALFVAAGRVLLAATTDAVQSLADASRLAGALAQIIQLGTAHISAPLDLDAGDER